MEGCTPKTLQVSSRHAFSYLGLGVKQDYTPDAGQRLFAKAGKSVIIQSQSRCIHRDYTVIIRNL